MSTPQVFHGCPACGRIVTGARCEDRATGVLYHPACFLRASLTVTPWTPAGYTAVVTQAAEPAPAEQPTPVPAAR